MAHSIPSANTPAHKAMLTQGEGRYLGVDKWENPSDGLPTGKMLIQFDFRDSTVIEKSDLVASNFFTDADTLLKHQNAGGEVHARNLAKALQVAPYRRGITQRHWYSRNIAIYQLKRDLKAEVLAINQFAEFGQSKTRNNIHLGDGVAPQYFIDIPKESFRVGAEPVLELKYALRCIEREHKFDWLEQLEIDKADDTKIENEIINVFIRKVNNLLAGTAEQQKHGREIAELYKINQELKSINPTSSIS